MYTYYLKPLIWCCFIDDNFMPWTYGLKALHGFVKHLNSCHPTLKFTFEYSKVSIPMLDTTITMYIKPTATHSYLHYSSCHPHHQNTGAPYSQPLRVKHICSKNTDFEYYAHKTMGHYKLRGYPESVVQSAWNKTKSVPRTQLSVKKMIFQKRHLWYVLPNTTHKTLPYRTFSKIIGLLLKSTPN